MPCNVWFNKPLSAAFSVFRLIREADTEGRYRLYCTHPREDFIGFLASHQHEREIQTLKDSEYLAFALDFCRRHHIDMLVATHRARLFSQHRDAFESAGVKRVVVTASTDVLGILDSKEELYRTLAEAGSIVPIPEYAVAREAAEFRNAAQSMFQLFPKLCVKPAVSMYGLGFRKLAAGGSELKRMMNGDVTNIGYEHLIQLLEKESEFPALMLMRYLEGAERSVDCLAIEGTLLTCVIRKKSLHLDTSQEVESNPDVVELARKLTTHFRLNGLYNIQFKDSGDQHYLLEINPRMSGGVPFTAVSGLNLPYWLLRTAEDPSAAAHLPQPRSGVRYTQYTACVATPA